MNTDIRISVSFRNHRKRKRLRMMLGPGSTDYLLDLWISAAMNRPSGVLHDMDEIDIALDAGWDGEPRQFIDALLQCGFIDFDGENYTLHDWEEHQGYVVHADSRRARAKKAAAKRWESKNSDGLCEETNQACPEHAESMPQACPEHAESMPQACPEHAESNAPSPAPAPAPAPAPLAKKNTYTQDFENFWRAYPARDGKKQGKKEAFAEWRKAVRDVDAGFLISQIESLATQYGQYPVDACRWLKHRRWEDEVSASTGTDNQFAGVI